MARPTRRPARIATLLLAASLASACAATGRPGGVNTSRMGVVKGPGVVAAGVLQLEAGYLHGDRGERTRDVLGEPLLRVGLGRETELRATFPSYLRTETPTVQTEGFGDAAIALKHRFRQAAGWMPGVSLTVGTTLPTGEDAFSAGQAQPEAIAAAEWRLPRQLAVIGTAGHRHAIAAGDRFGQNTLGAAARADLSRVVAAQVEYTHVTSTREGARDAGQLRATAAFRLTRDLQLDGWAGRITQGGAPDETLFGLGFTRRW